VITTLSILLSYAVDPLGWREDNPALKPRRLKIDSEHLRACVSVKRHIAMATLVIRNVEKSVHVRLKERAASHAQGCICCLNPSSSVSGSLN
jgi:hypothetical protein